MVKQRLEMYTVSTKHKLPKMPMRAGTQFPYGRLLSYSRGFGCVFLFKFVRLFLKMQA